MPKLHSRDALLSAINLANRPIVFVVGAPISSPPAGGARGVPGVAGMIGLVREAVQEYGLPTDKFDSALRSTTEAMQYQEAMSFLGSWVNQDAVNAVIARAVRMAYSDAAVAVDAPAAKVEEDLGGWSLTPAATALGALVVNHPERFRGPILTTNFDPLLSVAIRRAGGIAQRSVLDADGGFGREQVDDPGARQVIHLHGYWRDSDTLHTVEQLTLPRPKLKATLRQLLRDHMVVVVAYSGWDDVFTSALAEVVHEDRAIELVWAFHEDDPDRVDRRYRHLLEVVRPARTSNRFRMYGGVDAHWLFPALFDQAHSPPAVPSEPAMVSVSSPGKSPLDGWTVVNREFLSAYRVELDESELTRYFNGQVPTWHHAVSPLIPRRAVARRIAAELEERAKAKRGNRFHLITGAGGEGKSTILLQVAAMLAEKEDEWRVLWRSGPDVVLNALQAASLDDSKRAWLLVTDDGDQLVRELNQAVSALRLAKRTNIHLLASARDTDWIASGGKQVPWNQYVDFPEPQPLRGIELVDALELVRAWEHLGPAGLGELVTLQGESERAEALIEAAQQEAAKGEGSLFGGLLKTRIGAAGLAAHVQALMKRLQEGPVEPAHNLLEAFVYVAAIDAANLSGIELPVLADILGLSADNVRGEIEKRLGEEAAAVRTGTAIRTRHREIARTAVKLAGNFGFVLPEVYARIVRQTILTANRGVWLNSYNEIANGAHRIADGLSFALDEARRNEITIAAARAAMEARPERLRQVVSFCRTLRKVREFEAADRVFRSVVRGVEAREDYLERIRAFFYEWSVTAGELGSPKADVWLAGLALSDVLNPAEIVNEGSRVLAGLGVGFGKLADTTNVDVYRKALMASAVLGQRLHPDETTRGYLTKHQAHAERLGVTSPSLQTALTWLTAGVHRVATEVDDSLLISLAGGNNITFSLLATVLGAGSSD